MSNNVSSSPSASSSSPSSSFPRGTDVPFPSDRSPYPQQVNIMDAMLQALHRHQLLQQQQDKGQAHGDEQQGEKHRRALVMMLESPTGTGKSLSLAGAAMTWLRYMEQEDAQGHHANKKENEPIKKSDPKRQQQQNESSPTSTVTTTATFDEANNKTDNHNNNTCWWNAWVPPENQRAEEEEHRREQIVKTALNTRETLEHELNQLRRKLDPANNNQYNSSSKIATDHHKHQAHRQRERRENLVRSAVTTVKMMEKRQQSLSKGNRPMKRQNHSKQQKNPRQDAVVDYCVQEYQSDHEHHENDDDDDSIHSKDPNDHDKDESSWAKLETCLNGDYLDGSVKSSHTNQQHHQYSYKKGNETKDSTNTNTNTTMTSSMGSVQPGSGVRKIFYAARTHSQLSQMVREFERYATAADAVADNATNWESGTMQKDEATSRRRHVRVVALGGRQMLCQNTTHVNIPGRSESAITEACLDLLQKRNSRTTVHNKNGEDDEYVGTIQNKKKRRNQSANAQETGTTTTTNNNNDNGGGCPYMASRGALSTLALHLLARPSDIEDAGRLGAASHTCAYYATRISLAAAEVVVLPYNMLLSQQAREAVGLSLKGALVIFDEAHNLPEALRALHSTKLSLPVVEAALAQLVAYTERYALRLAGRNLHYLGQLRRILMGFHQYLQQGDPNNVAGSKNTYNTNPKHSSALLSPEELLVELKLDHINLFKILRYLKNTRLPQKLMGFVQHQTVSAEGRGTIGSGDNNNNSESVDARVVSKHVSAMAPVQSFLEKLVMTSGEGKVVTDWPSATLHESSTHINASHRIVHPTFRYVLLQPAAHFDNILEEAHAVAFVGGTLRPFAHMAAELLSPEKDALLLQEAKQADERLWQCETYSSHPPLSPSSSSPLIHSSSSFQHSSSCSTTFVAPRWTAFTCDHVIPPSHVRLECIGKGPTNVALDFRHTSRTSHDTCDELARVLIRICQVVPAGIVVFVPSYSYEACLVQRWKTTGSWLELAKYKRLYREPKSSQQVDETLSAYAGDAKNSSSSTGSNCGALLLSVMGGKMSEGINFADDMARCVVVVGLPYPDITDPVLKEKMKQLDHPPPSNNHVATIKSTPKSTTTMITGQAYYQNLCLRAINQSVGRAIRHAQDYAAIVLCDVRYTTDQRIWLGLPQWLRRSAAAAAAASTKTDHSCSGIHQQHHPRHGKNDVTFSVSMKRLEQFFRDKKK